MDLLGGWGKALGQAWNDSVRTVVGGVAAGTKLVGDSIETGAKAVQSVLQPSGWQGSAQREFKEEKRETERDVRKLQTDAMAILDVAAQTPGEVLSVAAQFHDENNKSTALAGSRVQQVIQGTQQLQRRLLSPIRTAREVEAVRDEARKVVSDAVALGSDDTVLKALAAAQKALDRLDALLRNKNADASRRIKELQELAAVALVHAERTMKAGANAAVDHAANLGGGALVGAWSGALLGMAVAGPVGVPIGLSLGLAGGLLAGHHWGKNWHVFGKRS